MGEIIRYCCWGGRPPTASMCQSEVVADLKREERIAKIEKQLMAWHKGNELSRRLAEIPAIGPIGASLLVMKVGDPQAFRSGRDFAAWLGLTPKDHSTAGKQRLGVITRAGDEALRSVLVVGATAVIQQARRSRTHAMPWLVDLLTRKPPKLAAVALANKTARIAWKLMVSGERYKPGLRPSRTSPSLPPTRSLAPCSRRQGRFAPPSAVACSQP
jgi:transposase